jgi:hypothetical protein
VSEHLAGEGYDIRYGARPLKRAIERELLASLSAAITRYAETQPLKVQVGVRQGKLQVDVTAVQLLPTRATAIDPCQAGGELAVAITAQRRLVNRLKGCSAASELGNRAAMSESLARRLAAAKWKTPEQELRLGQLPVLQQCLAGLARLDERACQLETEALSAFYQREQLEAKLFGPELEAVARERERLARDVFRLRLEMPDEIVLAVYSEARAALLDLGAAYYRLALEAGQVPGFDYLLPPLSGRSSVTRPVRQPPKKPDLPFESAPEKVIGLVMHLRGRLYFARFESESGLHLFQEKNDERACLVETARPPLAEYQPPRGIERQGAIKAKSAPVRRRFNRGNDTVTDSKLGERPWRGASFQDCLREVIEESLDRAIELMTA